MLNPIWLNTFVTLINTGHFTKTAEKLFMTQPGVSQQVSKLEQACGFTLIKRDKKSFDLTEQGRLVYDYATTLKKNEQTLLEALAFDNPHAGNCTIACSGSMALLLYPALLDLQMSHPSLIIKLTAAPNHQILNDIQKSNIELGIVTDVPNMREFDINKLANEELCLVLPKNIAPTGTLAETLINQGLVDHPDAKHYLSMYFEQCQEPSLKKLVPTDIPVVSYINQLSQILSPVAKGLGFTVLPKNALENFAQKELLTVIKPPTPVIETLYTVKKKNRTLPERYKALINVIHKLTGD
ncbi:LysR family transcriptional regulator [Pseudoalteromonas sp. KS88]|uniref:LysR family transcriptional regulator n=1 Tax=Pseudoalteromonas sp. KS88 TaxID=2109918 RepID=UPI001081AFD6|nr:LysR family transcriptional regulator [Pseudoalteromonas sp. KS88]TGE84687.1 LysR family transcriptional regulator [Pseudoalteromonas sp. KS88]